MNLKIITELTARQLDHSLDAESISLAAGTYQIKAVDDGQFEIKRQDGTMCYLSNDRLEEKIKEKAVIITNSTEPT